MSVILVLDDDPVVGRFMEHAFPSEHCFIAVQTWEQALDVLQDVQFDLILVDNKIGDISSETLIDKIRQLQGCNILLFAARSQKELVRLSQQTMADGYIQKILDPVLLAGLLQPHLENQALYIPEDMSQSSSRVDLSIFQSTLPTDTHKFVRKRCHTPSPVDLCMEDTSNVDMEKLLESSSF